MGKNVRTEADTAPKTSAQKPTAGTAKKPANNTSPVDEAGLLKDLFIDELKDIYWAEKHLTKALPKMRRAATSKELANAFEIHLAQTNEQLTRLEQVFELIGEKAKAIKCEGMEGLVMEGQKVMDDTPQGTSVRDAGLIISGQKIEHYEIAAYGSLVQLAKTLHLNDAANLLQLTLKEEKEADNILTQLAISSININAAAESK
ncbi:MAG: ferritin-like domain-containing protein [Chitinophagaceae bacterium]